MIQTSPKSKNTDTISQRNSDEHPMQYQFSSEVLPSLKMQSYFEFQAPGPYTSLKHSTLHQEDRSDTRLSNCFSPFHNRVDLSPYSQNFNDRERLGDSYNFNLDLERISQVQSFESLKPKSIEHLKLNSTDQFFCLCQESVPKNQSNQHDCFSQNAFQKQSEEAVSVTKANQASETKGWSKENEILLKKLAVRLKFDWKKISKKFGNKKYTPDFLKIKYKGQNEGVFKRVKFSHEEDVLIPKCFNDYGMNWKRMAHNFPNRTPVMLKNRFYTDIRKSNRLEGLLKETKTIEENHIGKNVSQCEQTSDFSVMCCGIAKDSQSQRKVSTDVTRGKRESESSKIDEVKRLKIEIKSLKSLYVAAYHELNKIKANQ